MAKLIIEMQEPSVEIPVYSKDASGVSKKIIVGFKRYETLAGESRMTDYERIVAAPGFEMLDSAELDTFIKEEILYLKKVELPLRDEETNKVTVMKIADTRKVKALETLWADPAECLDVLLDAYFLWSSWRVSFISAVQAALVDMSFEENSRKN